MHLGMVVVMVLLPTPLCGVAWCYSVGRDNTVGMVVVHQLPCALCSCRAFIISPILLVASWQ